MPDQLRVSDGWVRCGRCDEVFNAHDTLFDLRALPTPAAAPAADATPTSGSPPPLIVDVAAPAQATGEEAALAEDAGPDTPSPVIEPRIEPALEPQQALPAEVHGATPLEATDAAAAMSIALDATAEGTHAAAPELPVADTASSTAPEPAQAGADASATPEAPMAEAGDVTAPVPAQSAPDIAAKDAAPADDRPVEASATPTFVREAERAQYWQSLEMRALLGGAAVLLAGAALIQGLRGFHDPITAQWPQARAWVEPLCRLAGCRLEPARRLGALSVEGSSLVQIDGSALTRLSLVLRNRDRDEVLLPAIELTLTDVQGTVVARKVLGADELGAERVAIAGGAELTLQGALDTGSLSVVGYTIELFYP